MAECDCLPGCPFFNDRMASMSAMAGLMKKRYCQDDFMSCARHIVKVAVGSEKVPSDLYPSQSEKTDAIISAAKA